MKKKKNLSGPNRKELTIWDRQYILQMRERGMGIREIARRIGKNHSIVSRLLKALPYSPHLSRLTPLEKAQELERRAIHKRRSSRKRQRLKCLEIRIYVEEKLELGWSPELIAGRLSIEHPTLKTNHESIYQWIYKERRDLIKYLLVGGKQRRRKRGKKRSYRQKQPAKPKVSIDTRPKIVNKRKRFGDWEGDTVVSKQSTDCIFNLTERSSRYLILKKLPDCSAQSGSQAMIEMLSSIPSKLRHTITLDNGSENSAHDKVDRALDTKSYFCHPYCASERGTVENRNGFIRRFFPKKTNFALVSELEIEAVQEIHNHRPMKCLGFRTPFEVFSEACQS